EAVRLIKANNVAGLLGGVDVATADRIGKVAGQYGLALVTPCGDVTPQVGECVLSLGLSPARQGEILARFAAHDLKATRVAVVSDGRAPAGAGVATASARESPRDSTHRLDEFAYKGPPDVADLADRVNKAKPQALLHTGDAADFFKLRAMLRAAD